MTQHYIGTNILLALAMTRAAYNEYRGWQLPADENGADDGYLVEYQDGGKANHPDHAGYISWSPKAQFDAAYLPMGHVSHLAPHEQRVVGELAELADKVGKLRAFTGTTFFAILPEADRTLLLSQLTAMGDYEGILKSRVSRFNVAEA